MTELGLVIPDPADYPSPPPMPHGWCALEIAPAVLAADSWQTLDDYETRLNLAVSWLESFGKDTVELIKAYRVIEKRRIDLLGPARPGTRTDLQPLTSTLEVKETAMTVSRWRKIHRHWDKLWPIIVEAKRKRDVTQTAFLREAERLELADLLASREGPDYRLVESAVESLDDEIAPNSVDVILTDPPYAADAIASYEDLSRLGARVLKPGGSAFVMVGQAHLPAALNALTVALRYHWTIAYLTPGGQSPMAPMSRCVNSFWKPVIWLVKGIYEGPFLGDVARSGTNENEKDLHDWGQSESGIRDLVLRCSRIGDLILDPFVGGGTVGRAAIDLGRRFIGADQDEEALAVAAGRLSQ